MNQYLNIEELPNGNLKISLTKDGIEELTELRERNKDYTGIWLDLLESYSCNGSYQLVMPEKIGALTDAPIIGINFTWDDNGEIDEYDNVKYWYFADYMVKSEFDLMLNEGFVEFESANESANPAVC